MLPGIVIVMGKAPRHHAFVLPAKAGMTNRKDGHGMKFDTFS
jgi:hypothetical protein